MINTISMASNMVVQEENGILQNKTKCSGCRNQGHNIKNCNNEYTIMIKSYYEYWFIDYLKKKFSEIDKIKIINNILNPDIIDLESTLILMHLNVKTLRIINAKNGVSGKTKKQLINLFIYNQIKRFLHLIAMKEIEFNIKNIDTLFIINCYRNYYGDLSNGDDINQSLINFKNDIESYFETNFKIIILNVIPEKLEKEKNEYFDCAICLETYKVFESGVITDCNHTFCGKCMKELFTQDCEFNKKKCCSLCRNDIKCFTVYNKDLTKLLYKSLVIE